MDNFSAVNAGERSMFTERENEHERDPYKFRRG